jgi:DNA-binding MarR family transcriptional regulator
MIDTTQVSNQRDSAAPMPQGCTNFQLRQLMRRVSQHYDGEMGKIDLKTTQYSLLSHVVKLGPIRPGDLAAAMKMEPSTLTRNLKPLVTAGWVTLEAGDDGRSRSVTITEAGRAKRTEAQRRWKVAQLSLNQTLGVQRVAALHVLIRESLDLLSDTRDELGAGADDV